MKVSKLAVLSVLGLAIVSCDGKKGTASHKDVALTTKLDSVSYALGMARSGDVKRLREGVKKNFGLTVNKPAYMLGFENGIDSTSFKIDVEKGKDLLNSFGKKQTELAKKRKETNATPVDLPISSDASLKTVMDSVSYALGVQNGMQISMMKNNYKKVIDLDLNVNAIKSGYFSGADSLNIKINDADSKTMLDKFFKAKQEEAMQKNKKLGEDFIAQNKTKEGVKTTASGLQYSVINEGTGKTPTVNSMVKVHYHGTLIDGTVFDSSVDRKEPIEFPVNGVIKGWTEGLQLMKTGSKYRFYIPQELAYGAKSPSPDIKAFSTLIFDVELLEVKAKTEEQIEKEKQMMLQQQQMEKQIQEQIKQQQEQPKK